MSYIILLTGKPSAAQVNKRPIASLTLPCNVTHVMYHHLVSCLSCDVAYIHHVPSHTYVT